MLKNSSWRKHVEKNKQKGDKTTRKENEVLHELCHNGQKCHTDSHFTSSFKINVNISVSGNFISLWTCSSIRDTLFTLASGGSVKKSLSKTCIGNHRRPKPPSFWNPSLSRPLVVIEFLLAAITAIVGVDAIVVELPHWSITPGHPLSPWGKMTVTHSGWRMSFTQPI